MTVTLDRVDSAESEIDAVRYASLLDRAETILDLIVDGTLDPHVGLSYIVWPTEVIEDAQQARARRQHEHGVARRRFDPDARERALALVAGGVSYRVAASVALGDERHRMSVWRWAREQRARERRAA